MVRIANLEADDVVEVSFVQNTPLDSLGRTNRQLRVTDQMGDMVYFEMPYDDIGGQLLLDTKHNELYHRDFDGKDSLFGDIARIEEVVPDATA